MNKLYCVFKFYEETKYTELIEITQSSDKAHDMRDELNLAITINDYYHYRVESFFNKDEMWNYINTINE
jgi:hypothetical protein